MSRFAPAGLAAALLVATGCASVPLMPEADDQAAKAFAPPPAGQAQVYVYRHENFGAAVKLGVLLDGFLVGETAAKTYALLPLTPGKHQLGSVAENRSTLDLEAVAGKTYYVWQEVKMGLLQAGSKLSAVDEATGQSGVRECRRMMVTLPPTAPVAKPAAVPAS